MTEYEDISTDYEFEDRAELFKTDVEELSKDFPDLMAEVENKTRSDLAANLWVLKRAARSENGRMENKAFRSGYPMEAESANRNSVTVMVHGRKKKDIREFIQKVDGIAKSFLGHRSEDYLTEEPEDTPDDQFRFFTRLLYYFED